MSRLAPDGGTPGLRLLHVEDDTAFAELVASFLEREFPDLTIYHATDADEGTSLLEMNEVDCILSDYEMPGRNGVEFLEDVRTDHPNLPFILCTGKGSEEVASQAISAGVTDYLQKDSGTDCYELLAKRIENAVEKSYALQNYRELFENSAVGVSVFDPEAGEIVDVNTRFCEILGRDEAEILGTHPATLSPPDSQFSVESGQPLLDRTLEEGPQTFEWLHLRGDGSNVWVEVTLNRTTINGHERILGVIRDISDRKEQRDALAQAKARFQTFVELSNDLITVVDKDRTIRYASPAVTSLLGYSQETITGNDFVEHIHPDDQAQVNELFESFSSEPGTTTGTAEFRIQHADGGWRWLEALGSNRTDSAINGYVINARDITSRRERMQQLERERNRFEAVFEAVPEPVVHVRYEDDKPIIKNVNTAFESVFGYSDEASRGESLDALIIPDGHRAEADEINQGVRDEGLIEREVIRETVSGERPFLFTARMLDCEMAEEGGEYIEGVGSYVDLSEQKRRESELERQNQRLNEFASVVSHDLRNPLYVAESRLDLAAEDCDSEHLESVRRAHRRMETLIDDLLTMARSGAAVTDHEPVSVSTVVDNAWSIVETSDATVVADLERTVMADESRLQQLFENLFRNAVEHGGETVTVRVGALPDGLFIEDDGPGIPEADRANVFDAGYSTSSEGIGFGLNIVAEIVEAHDWDIKVTEGKDGGARFEITEMEFDE